MPSSACSSLQGRTLTIPRNVFLQDINRGSSREPPNGDAWRAIVKDIADKGVRPFLLELQVLDEDGELEDEYQDATLTQVRAWIDLEDGEEREQVGADKREERGGAGALAICESANTVSANDLFVQTPNAK
jgi:hypothetical protein